MISKTVVIDANVLISAYGLDGEVRRYWRESLRDCQLLVSPEILIEVESRLRNSEFNLAGEEIKAALLEILKRCQVVRPNPVRDPNFKNPRDSHLAALARHKLANGAAPQFLLTDGESLLREGKIGNCEILRIETFCVQEAGSQKPGARPATGKAN